MAVNLMNHLNQEEFDVRMCLLRRYGPYLDLVDNDFIDSPGTDGAFAFDHLGNRAVFKPGRLIRGGLLAPVYLARMMRIHRPHVVISFCKGTSIATMAATWICGGRKFQWIVREGNNTEAVISDELQAPLSRQALKWLTYRCFSSADCLLTTSHQLADHLRKHMPRQPRRLRTIHNAVDLDFIDQKKIEELAGAPGKPYCIAAGRLQHQKGFDILISAYAKMKGNKDLDLVILGVGHDEEQLKGLAEKLGVADRVHFTGWQDGPWTWFARSRFLVLPSRWEGFANVVTEAMSCGTPVIATDCGFGPREIIRNNVNGLLCPVEDDEALSLTMDLLASDEKLRDKLVKAGFRRAKDFDIRNIVKKYENLMREQVHDAALANLG
ncbi:glycosyltransferase [Nocardiopsis gilva]